MSENTEKKPAAKATTKAAATTKKATTAKAEAKPADNPAEAPQPEVLAKGDTDVSKPDSQQPDQSAAASVPQPDDEAASPGTEVGDSGHQAVESGDASVQGVDASVDNTPYQNAPNIAAVKYAIGTVLPEDLAKKLKDRLSDKDEAALNEALATGSPLPEQLTKRIKQALNATDEAALESVLASAVESVTPSVQGLSEEQLHNEAAAEAAKSEIPEEAAADIDMQEARELSEEEKVHALREDIDEVMQVVDALETPVGPYQGSVRAVAVSAPLNECVTQLRMGKQWLGKVCEARGYASPHRNDYKEKSDIAPTADVKQHPGKGWKAGKDMPFERLEYVSQLTFLRAVIGDLIDTAEHLEAGKSRHESIALTQVYVHLSNARMAIGWEFARVRETK